MQTSLPGVSNQLVHLFDHLQRVCPVSGASGMGMAGSLSTTSLFRCLSMVDVILNRRGRLFDFGAGGGKWVLKLFCGACIALELCCSACTCVVLDGLRCIHPCASLGRSICAEQCASLISVPEKCACFRSVQCLRSVQV